MKYGIYLNYILVCGIFFLSHSCIFTEMDEIPVQDAESYENKDTESDENKPEVEQDAQLILDDEKLSEEIISIIASSYKEIIDVSALYFCGLIGWDKLYDQIVTLSYKDFFKVIKLFFLVYTRNS